MLKKISTILLAGLIGIIAFTACKKKTVTAAVYTPPAGSFGQMYTKILGPSCAFSGCHNKEDHTQVGHSHGISLEGDSTYYDLINNTPKNSQAVTANLKMVAPGDTAKSFFFHKVNYNNSPHKYGAPMPGGGLVLSANQIKFIEKWILAGAPESGYVVDSTLLN